MSMMVYGITHCMKCLQPYHNGECDCTREEKRKKQKKLDILLDMTIDEIKTLRVLAMEKIIEKQLEK